MVSKWFLGAVSAAGVAAGFSVSAVATPAQKAHSTGYAEVQTLYHKELALGNREQELQFLLKLRTAQQVAAGSHPVAGANPAVGVAPSRPQAVPSVHQASSQFAPATTTTTAVSPPPDVESSPPTTTTAPPTTTTTTVAPTTTTTTSPESDDGGLLGGLDH